MITIDNQKQCSKCKEWKPATNEFFSIRKAGLFGLNSQCKRCSNEINRKWYEANPERKKETGYKWREANPERKKENDRKWSQANSQRQKEIARKWNQSNPERVKENARKWLEANPKKISEYMHKRRAREANAAGTATAEQIKARFQFHENRCYYCGDNKSGLHVEHRIPLSRGGSNWPANIVPACPTCNRTKHTKTEKEFLEK